MYKIEIRYSKNNAYSKTTSLYKKKFYESRKQFARWKKIWAKRVKKDEKDFPCYMNCYRFTNKGTWKKVK